jgi:hypothetical protein
MNGKLEIDRSSPLLFNSAFETGVRTICILAALSPERPDLEDLIALDHLVVHSVDVGGPNSIHPPTSSHATEMLVRRELIQKGLLLMQTRGLVERSADNTGIRYRAGEEAHNFISYLTSEYFQQLKAAASYLAGLRRRLGKGDFDGLVGKQLERWAIQFQSADRPGAGS